MELLWGVVRAQCGMKVPGSCISEGGALFHSLAVQDQDPGSHHGIRAHDGCCLGSLYHMGVVPYNADSLLDVNMCLFPWCFYPICRTRSIETFQYTIKKLLPYPTQIKH